jgi:hypothetical protein
MDPGIGAITRFPSVPVLNITLTSGRHLVKMIKRDIQFLDDIGYCKVDRQHHVLAGMAFDLLAPNAVFGLKANRQHPFPAETW